MNLQILKLLLLLTSLWHTSGLSSENVLETPEEQNLKTCHEGGAYQIAIIQKREVDVITRHQNGKERVSWSQRHKNLQKSKGWQWQLLKQRYKELKNDSSIKTKSISHNQKNAHR